MKDLDTCTIVNNNCGHNVTVTEFGPELACHIQARTGIHVWASVHTQGTFTQYYV